MATFTCPRCHSLITSKALELKDDGDNIRHPYNFLYYSGASISPQSHIQFLYKCTNENCKTLIIRECTDNEKHVDREFPSVPKHFDFSPYPNINELSPSFINIYNESYQVEQLGYKDISGPGYRKAIEFLIKDYIIKLKLSNNINTVNNMYVGTCIEKFIDDKKISELSKRAFRLGNDQTHYYQKWEDKDLNDLKNIIQLLLHYIESNLEYKKIISEMN